MQPATVVRFLVIPLRMAPALLIATFSLLLVLATKATLLGIPLAFVLLSGFFNYAFILLDGIADGAHELPVLSIEMLNPISGQRSLVLLIVIVIAFFASSAATYWFGPWFAIAGAVVCATVLPAMIAVQGATGSVAQSLNLLTCFRLMQRLGTDYALILAGIGLLGIAGVAIVSASGGTLPLIVRIALLMYGWLAIFALIGGVLFERRLDLGLDDSLVVEPDEASTDAQRERMRTQLVDRIYAEWRGGARETAWQTIGTHLAKSIDQGADPMVELRWLYERIARWPDPRLANRLAQELLPRLMATRHTGEALDIVRARLKADADFRLPASNDLLNLVRLARDAGDRPTARALLRDFHRFYPDDSRRTAADALILQLDR